MTKSLTDYLVATQAPSGGWGYEPDQRANVEATSAVVLALADVAEAGPARARGLAWLVAAQHADGGWGYSPDDTESSWQSAWAVWALAGSDSVSEECAKGVSWLLSVPSAQFTADELSGVERILAIDVSIPSWPWRSGETTWVEPTALALVALRAAGAGEAARSRISAALDYLGDRRCRGGGWNFGNPYMLGSYLPARAQPTGCALLALAGLQPQRWLSEDVGALRADMELDGGVVAWAWGILALRAVGAVDSHWQERLLARQSAGGGVHSSPFKTALAALALGRLIPPSLETR
jgi:hypothetical protein